MRQSRASAEGQSRNEDRLLFRAANQISRVSGISRWTFEKSGEQEFSQPAISWFADFPKWELGAFARDTPSLVGSMESSLWREIGKKSMGHNHLRAKS